MNNNKKHNKKNDFFAVINDLLDKDVEDLSIKKSMGEQIDFPQTYSTNIPEDARGLNKHINKSLDIEDEDSIEDENDIDINEEDYDNEEEIDLPLNTSSKKYKDLDDEEDEYELNFPDAEDINESKEKDNGSEEKEENDKMQENNSESDFDNDQNNFNELGTDDIDNNAVTEGIDDNTEDFNYIDAFFVKRKDGKFFIISEAESHKVSAEGLQEYKEEKMKKGESFDDIDLKTYMRNIVIQELLPSLYTKTYTFIEKVKQNKIKPKIKSEEYLKNISERGAEYIESERVIQLNNILEQYGATSGIVIIYATGEIKFFIKIEPSDVARKKTWKREKLDELEEYKAKTKNQQLRNEITYIEYKNRIDKKEKEINNIIDNPDSSIPTDNIKLAIRIFENATEKIMEKTEFINSEEKKKFRKKPLKQRIEEVQKSIPPFSMTGAGVSRSGINTQNISLRDILKKSLSEWKIE